MKAGFGAFPRWIAPVAVAVLAGAVLAGRTGHGDLLAPALVVTGAMVLWATRALPEHIVAFLFFTACAIGTIAPMSVVLSGFVGPAVWLTISGAVIGAALRHTGLADRLAALLARMARGRFPTVLAKVALFSAGLMFLMPSAMGRVLLLLPLLEALATRLGFPAGSRARTGLMLAGVFGTFVPAMAVLPANVPNNVLAGMMESTGIRVPSFSEYLILHFPVLGIGKLALIIAILAVMHRDLPPVGAAEPDAAPSATPMTGPERHLTLLLLLTIGLWFTDVWHGISPAWIGMAAAIVCLWPGTQLMPPQSLRAVGLEPVFYVAGVIGIGSVVDHTALGRALGHVITGLVPGPQTWPGFTVLALSAIATVIGLILTVIAIPAILTPLSADLSTATGLPVMDTAMAQVIGFSTIFLPYQAPPLAVSIQMGSLPAKAAAKFAFTLATLSVVLLWPLVIGWWWLLGKLG